MCFNGSKLLQKKLMEKIELQSLGARARARREALGLSRAAIAPLIPTIEINLANWEKSLPRHQKADAGWESALGVAPGWLRSTTDSVPSPQSFVTGFDASVESAIDIMQAVFAWYSRRRPATRTHDIHALSKSESRSVEILLQRYGAKGEPLSSLQAAGEAHGITRERVRQITESVTSRITDNALPTTLLDHLRIAIEPRLPCTVAKLDSSLRGLLGPHLSIEGVERFAREILGMSVVRIKVTPGAFATTRMAVRIDAPEDGTLAAIRNVVLAMIRTTGAAQIHYVAGAASEALATGVSPAEVLECCKMHSKFEWLVEADGWFWLGPSTENRVKNCTMKVLCVANRNVDIEELAAAIARVRITRYGPDVVRPYLINAPLPVLKEIVTRFPMVTTLQHNDFRMAERLGSQDGVEEAYLSDTERDIAAVIRGSGGIASRSQLVADLVDSGRVIAITLNMTLDSSPVVRRIDSGLWALCGTTLSPAALGDAYTQSVVKRRVRTRVQDGWHLFDVRLPASAVERGDWFVPVGLADILSIGEYAVDGFSDPALFVNTERGNPTLKRFVNQLMAAGLDAQARFCLGVHPDSRKIILSAIETERPPEAAIQLSTPVESRVHITPESSVPI